jgi:hypothetical protein
VHTFVSVFGADRYMHVMTAMTVNAYSATWSAAIAHPGADLKTAGAHGVGAGKLDASETNVEAITDANTLTLAKTESAGKFEVGEAGVDVTFTLAPANNVASSWIRINEIT